MKDKFEKLINRFKSESDIKDGIKPFSNEEITFMAKYSFKNFNNKYPSLSKFYIQFLKK